MYWGDGVKTGTDTCDDNNIVNGDGWSDICNPEAGYSWKNITTTYDQWDLCGNGIKFTCELCDDGNASDGDGCSSSWNVEVGWYWTGGTMTSKDTCDEFWGDGKKFNSLATYWDDGNKLSKDGWDSSCNVGKVLGKINFFLEF